MKKSVIFVLYVCVGVLIALCTSHPAVAAGFRKKITIDHTKVFDGDQLRIPVLIHITDPSLKSAAEKGHVSRNDGSDIYFTLPDGKTVLPSEKVSYDPRNGEIKDWVIIPTLSDSKDTDIFIQYGVDSKASSSAWDETYSLVLHLDKAKDPDRDVPDSNSMKLDNQLTVEAWVQSDTFQPETIEPLVAKWALLTTFNTFDAYDASSTDGLETRGYFGCVYDGRYVYFSPIRTTVDFSGAHGRVLRYDTYRDFKDPESYDAFDAGNTDGLNTKGYCGLAFDGRYVYFVPRHDGKVYHSRFLRYDTYMQFKDQASWSAYDVGVDSSHEGAAFDGRYLYFPPTDRTENGKKKSDVNDGRVIRFDTRGDFKDSTSWRVFDTSRISKLAVCFDGANFDGRYVYLTPIYSGITVRYDTKSDFGNVKSWEAFDARSLGMKVQVGTTYDGRYMYPVHYYYNTAIRYDTHGPFTKRASWESYNHGKVNGLETSGFAGGFFDGKYVYYVPFEKERKPGEQGSPMHTNYMRYNTLGTFNDPKSWETYDAGNTSGIKTVGFNSGIFDGRYFYTAPFRNPEGGNGEILRYDTVGSNGSFVLKYCNNGSNGGLTASVTGPSFTVNTVKGPLNVFATEALLPGWRHLTGVYTGKTIKLFVDGILVSERAGTGTIQTNSIPVSIGRYKESSARFKGIIDEVRISSVARDDGWIKTSYQNLIKPDEFISVGKEETVR